MDKNERIELKRAELMQSFETLPAEQLKVAQDLIAQAGFMAVELEDLAEIISKEGMTEVYTNGANQSGRKISSNAKMYGVLIGKYNSVIAKLLAIVPPHVETQTERLSALEKAKIEKEAEQASWREVCQFIERAEANSTPENLQKIQELFREVSDQRERARLIRERGLYCED